MPVPQYLQQLNTLISSTLWTYAEKALVDQVFKGAVLLQELRSRGRVKALSGGDHIRIALEYGKAHVRTIHYKEAVPIVPHEFITAAIYPWRYLTATQMLYSAELAMNRGAAQIIDMLESSTRNVEKALTEKLNQMLFGDGTGNDGKDWLGLQAIVDDTRVLGGIDPAQHPFWKSYVDATPGSISFDAIGAAITATSVEGTKPNLIVTTPTLWDKLHNSLTPQQRYADARIAQWGFDNFVIRGNIPVVFDRDCPEGHLFVLNTNYLYLYHHEHYFLKPIRFMDLPNAAARVGFWFTMGNFVTSSRRVHGVLKNKT